MDLKSALSVQHSKAEQLAAIEEIIRQAIANGREAIRQIGSGFTAIWDQNLWQLSRKKHRDFYAYAYDAFGLEARSVKHAIAASRAFRTLEEAHLQLPANDSQAFELSKLDDALQPVVWKRVLETCAEKNLGVTTLRVREAVTQEKDDQKNSEKEEEGGGGVYVDMEEDELFLSERGEEALARIKALCGAVVADAIRQKKNDKITEEAVRKWAAQEDDTVRELPRYVVDKDWSVRRALNYLAQVVEGDTEVDELVMMARNRGGRFSGHYQDARIIVEIKLGNSA